MSRCPTVRAKQRKNPLLPVDSLAFTVRRAAALPAAHPAEAMALPGAGEAVSPRTSRGEAASPVRVLPVAADFPRTPRGEAASPARVLPEAVALVVHSPKPLRKRKYPSPVQQEPGRRRQLESLGWELLALSLAQQESRPAAHSVLPFLNPGTVGMCPRYLPRPHQGHRVPVRYSRNSAGALGRTGPRQKAAAPPSTPARQEW